MKKMLNMKLYQCFYQEYIINQKKMYLDIIIL